MKYIFWISGNHEALSKFITIITAVNCIFRCPKSIKGYPKTEVCLRLFQTANLVIRNFPNCKHSPVT